MTLEEVQKNLLSLKEKGFVTSKREGPTGVGYTLEQELNLTETNLSIPDIDGQVELKATRKDSNSLVTLFTFNRAVWKFHQRDIIKKYGYLDESGRQALFTTVLYNQPNPQNLTIELDSSAKEVHLYHNSGGLLATWSLYTIVEKFVFKLKSLLIVLADNRIDDISGKEMFYYKEAYLLERPSPNRFIIAFKNSQIAIDLRMYLKDTGTVRNHGTAFRITENNVIDLYRDRKKIL